MPLGSLDWWFVLQAVRPRNCSHANSVVRCCAQRRLWSGTLPISMRNAKRSIGASSAKGSIARVTRSWRTSTRTTSRDLASSIWRTLSTFKRAKDYEWIPLRDLKVVPIRLSSSCVSRLLCLAARLLWHIKTYNCLRTASASVVGRREAIGFVGDQLKEERSRARG